MSETEGPAGTVNIARNLFNHAVFAPDPLTEREAWVWLIMQASWKARTRRMANAVVWTERGELAASVRFMADAWKWAPARVQRYLKRLQKMGMITSKTDTGVTIISVCNYDNFQYGVEAPDTAPIQQRYSSDTKEKKGRREEGQKKDAEASSSADDDSRLPDDPEQREARLAQMPPVRPSEPGAPRVDEVAEAIAIYSKAAERQGWPIPTSKPSDSRRAAIRGRIREAGGLEGWSIAIEKAAASRFLGSGRAFSGFGIDWIAKTANFTKIMEGNYDDQGKPARQNSRAAAADDAALERIQAAARHRRSPGGDCG